MLRFPHLYLLSGKTLVVGYSNKLSITEQIKRLVATEPVNTHSKKLVFYTHDHVKLLSVDLKHSIKNGAKVKTSFINDFEFANAFCRQRGAIFAYICFIKGGQVFEFVE